MFCNLKKLTKRYKNKKILFYFMSILSIFSIFFITDKVDALSMNVNGTDIEVANDNYIYYFYTLKPELFEKYDYFFSFMNSDGSYRFAFTNVLPSTTSSFGHFVIDNELKIRDETYYCRYTNTFTLTSCQTYTTNTNLTLSGTHSYFHNFDMLNTSISGLSSSNISLQQIKDYFNTKKLYKITYYVNNELYQTMEVEEGSNHNLLDYSYNNNTHIFSGWQYDEELNFTNITSDIIINATLEKKDVIPVYIEFPISKNEFYALLVEVGVLIMIIFLKWCFPFKGGSDLK